MGERRMAASRPKPISAPTAVKTIRSAAMMKTSGGHTSAGQGLVAKDGTQLRVVAPAEQNIETGAPVWLHLPAEHCRALMG